MTTLAAIAPWGMSIPGLAILVVVVLAIVALVFVAAKQFGVATRIQNTCTTQPGCHHRGDSTCGEYVNRSRKATTEGAV